MSKKTHSGYQYIITLIDEDSRHATIKFLKKKSETTRAIQNYIAWYHNTTNQSIKVFRDDKGGEYTSKELYESFKSLGITYQETHKATPHENGLAERYNRTLLDASRTLLAKLPDDLKYTLSGEALAYSNHTKNNIPHSTTKKIPQH